ncbi:MAG TPA: hypothetical protein VIN71_03015 [Pseudomonadales bacterium]
MPVARLAMLAAALLLTACDDKNTEDATESPLHYSMETMDKAKEVEALLQEVEKQRREQASE